MKKKKRFRFWLCVLVILFGAVFAVGKGYRLLMENMYPLLYTEYIEEEAAKNDLDPAFLCAVIRTESRFDPEAVSHADAHGLMQITPATFDWLKTKLQDGDLYSQEDIYDPKVNIHFGAGYLRYLLNRYEGEKETEKYVEAVLRSETIYQDLYGL